MFNDEILETAANVLAGLYECIEVYINSYLLQVLEGISDVQ